VTKDVAAPDPWGRLRPLTPARIALGRAGASLPLRPTLDFALAHARARDAVHAALDAEALAARLGALGLTHIRAASAAPDRHAYLRRPDLGRRLDAASRERLGGIRGEGFDLAIVLADGLSAAAVEAQAPALLAAMLPGLRAMALRLAPMVVATQARVAIGDEIGEVLGARLALVLIGERPGLSSPRSLGGYLTFAPQVGRTDAERNCISNIREGGLSAERAGAILLWLIGAALRRGVTGVELKDASAEAPRIGGDGEGA